MTMALMMLQMEDPLENRVMEKDTVGTMEGETSEDYIKCPYEEGVGVTAVDSPAIGHNQLLYCGDITCAWSISSCHFYVCCPVHFNKGDKGCSFFFFIIANWQDFS